MMDLEAIRGEAPRDLWAEYDHRCEELHGAEGKLPTTCGEEAAELKELIRRVKQDILQIVRAMVEDEISAAGRR